MHMRWLSVLSLGMPLPLPEHLSFSQVNTYNACPRRYFLSRVRGAPATPAWYLLTGSAIHDGIEQYIKTGERSDPVVLLNHQASSALKAEPDLDKWLHGGSKTEPIVKERALKLVIDSLENAYNFLDSVTVLPGTVEMDVSSPLPGTVRPVKGFIDILALHRDHGPIIVDWKSSSSKPKDAFQLETYRALLMQKGGYDEFKTGLWVMLRPGVSKARPVDLSHVTPEMIGERYAETEKMIDGRIWPARSDFMCNNYCEQKVNCSLMSGKTTRTDEWDTAHEDGIPF